jgi:hypothetical protein
VRSELRARAVAQHVPRTTASTGALLSREFASATLYATETGTKSRSAASRAPQGVGKHLVVVDGKYRDWPRGRPSLRSRPSARITDAQWRSSCRGTRRVTSNGGVAAQFVFVQFASRMLWQRLGKPVTAG